VYLDEKDATRAKQMADWTRLDLEHQYHIVRGMESTTKQAVTIKYPRTNSPTTQDACTMALIYIAERSMAATEFLSRGTYEQCISVYNYIGFNRAMAPPFTMQVAAAILLQKIYPQRLYSLVMIDPPFWVKGVLNLFHPFLSESIQQKIQLVNGIPERESVFSSDTVTIDVPDAPKLLRVEGSLTEPVSLDHFLSDVPFFYLYDMVPCTRTITETELQLDAISHTMPDSVGGGGGTGGPSSSLVEQASNLWGNWTSTFSTGTSYAPADSETTK
jgi:hypothetical protein